MRRRLTYLLAAGLLCGAALLGGTALAHPAHGGYEHTTPILPKCHEDAAVVLVITKWGNGAQQPIRPAVSCAALDDLYLP